MEVHYGKCPCGGIYERRTVEVRLTVEGEALILPDVPQGVCPVCGSRVYKLDVLERIEATMKRSLMKDLELGLGRGERNASDGLNVHARSEILVRDDREVR